jgi:hypothetical protein
LPAPARRIQDDVGLIERVLATWRVLRAGSHHVDQCLIPAFAAVRASNHVDDARRLGLSEREDIVAFTLHHLCIHPRLHTVPAVSEMVEAAARGRAPLAALLARYSEAQWRQLIECLPKSESRL